MSPSVDLTQKINDILDIARLAPSVHNAQPWKIALPGPDTLRITIDKDWKPEEGDPTGRQTTISLGIFVEALDIAAATFGLRIRQVQLKDEVASITFEKGETKSSDEQTRLLCSRCSDRSVYKPIDMTPAMIRQLETVPVHPEVSIKVITDKAVINEIADLTQKGIGVALSSPEFRMELSRFLTLPWSPKKRGIAVRSLYIPWWIEFCEPLFMKLGLGMRAEVALEKRRWLSASGVIVILANGDMPQFWLEAGRAYLRASLQIEDLGLSQATSAAIVEASNYQEDIEERLGTDQRILALIRIGKGSAKRHYSPRLNAKDLLT